ncbi:fluoride efflux transporter CrcB [Terrilactibacillus laevilacticus]|uniref:Fluoride-specific ion channel FluC n=1 Tax=Terrilactibacillus laevilacticus TaxID=1380157 RepID=A0ABW5PPB3_9BACI|nr:fluoride efflux transporter CrcB [Terrilactibacillus laevilacticus]
MLHLLQVSIGGFLGATARFFISNMAKKNISSTLPIGTLCINWIGSFLLGFIAGSDFTLTWVLILGTGFMGAFTTFSTLNLELIQLLKSKKWKAFGLYLTLTYLVGLFLAYLGLIVAIE